MLTAGVLIIAEAGALAQACFSEREETGLELFLEYQPGVVLGISVLMLFAIGAVLLIRGVESLSSGGSEYED